MKQVLVISRLFPDKFRKEEMKTGKSSIAISVFSILLLLGILFFGAVPTVHAAEIDGDGIVNSDETINDDQAR